MTNYRRGVRAEYRARDLLKASGYHTVVRSAGSKSPFDLIAISSKGIALVQVKRGRAISKPERAAMLAAKAEMPIGCTVEIWTFAPRQKLPTVEVL